MVAVGAAQTQKVADIVDDELTMSRMNVADVPRDDAPLQASHISHEDHSQVRSRHEDTKDTAFALSSHCLCH